MSLREQIAAVADTVVVKVGTRVLTDARGALDLDRVAAVAEQVASATDGGRRVALVSSGAVGAGIGRLGLPQRPIDLARLQAAAAIGQSRLIEVYNQALEAHGHHAAQVLLTADDLNDRRRYLNTRNTLLELFRFGAVPIVNENDTVRVDELQRSVGDNDRLAAVVTNLLRAPLLVLLSDVDGLYDGDPDDAGSKVLPVVESINDDVLGLTRATAAMGPRLSTGGMASKLAAAQMATGAGENVVVANGRRPGVLSDILAGADVGTLFVAQQASVSSRKRWIGRTAQPVGRLTLDAGAARAITTGGNSLLPVGVVAVAGEFGKGDVVSLVTAGGDELARGLTNYDHKQVAAIRGRSTEDIPGILGHRPYLEVVHRDNLALVD
ncbi:MAG: glutamate 5-kinase [Planctomycetota bacterium]